MTKSQIEKTMLIVLNSAWEFIKKHWQTIALVVVVVACYAWIHRQKLNFARTLEDLNRSHQVEIDKINQALADEERQHAAELKQLKDSLAKIEADYELAQSQLVKQQRQEAHDISVKYGHDADGLAQLVADRMGFVVVKPPSP
jgi:GTP-binding protein EngB required for normal cell division